MQQPFTVIRFQISDSVHLGSHREELDRSDNILHSDTLYSAIIQAWEVLGVEHPVLDYEGEVAPDLGFAISSLFPFFQETTESAPLYFFPVPKAGLPETDPDQYRNVKWLDAKAFEYYLKNGRINEQQARPCGDYFTDHAGFDQDGRNERNARKPVSSKKQDFMRSEVQPRAYVPRLHEADTDTVIYYIERIFFREQCGLFGLATFDNDEIKAKVLLALDHLQDAGIGTDRNVGHGQFRYATDKFEYFTELPDSDHALNLSLFCPESPEQLADMLASDHCRHDLTKRGGWMTTWPYLSYRKDSVYMFREGGIFKTKQPVAGSTVNLRPDILDALDDTTPVLRVGKSIFLPVTV